MDLVATNTYDAPLSFGGVIGIVIASCALGLVWAFINYLGVKKINLEGGQGEYESLASEVSEGQVKLLLELGTKISEVKCGVSLGSQRILEAGVSRLHYFCWCDVFHHLRSRGKVRTCLHCLRLCHRSSYLHGLRPYRYVHRHIHKLQSYLLRQKRTSRRLQNCLQRRMRHGLRSRFARPHEYTSTLI